MNPQLMKLLARLKGMGAEGVKMADKGMGMAGAGIGGLAGKAARNPKMAAGIGATGAGAAGLGLGAAMGDEEDDSEIEMDPEALMQLIEQLKGQGGNMMKRGRAALGM